MKRVPTSLEITGLLALSILGLYLLYIGTTEQSSASLIGGAACFALGVATLLFAIKNSLSNRQMFRHAMGRNTSRDPDSR